MRRIKFVLVLALLLFAAYQMLVHFVFAEKGLRVVFVSGKAYLDNAAKKELRMGDFVPVEVPVKLALDSLCLLQNLLGAVIRLSSKTSVEIQGDQKAIRLTAGALEYDTEGKSVPLHPDILTPQADLRLDSRHCLVVVDERRTALSVYQGRVTGKVSGHEFTVEEGQGVILVAGSRPRVVSLPARPEISSPASGASIDICTVAASARPVAGADRYRWAYSLNEAFSQVTLEQFTSENSGNLRRPLQDGAYFLRTRAFTRDNLAGMPSSPVGFRYGLYEKLRPILDYARNFYINKKDEDKQKAVDWSRKGLELCPDHAELQKYLALGLYRLGMRDEAAHVIEALNASPWREAQDSLEAIAEEIRRSNPRDRILEKLPESH